MNLREQLLREHSRPNADLILAYVLKDKRRTAKLMDLFLDDEYRVGQRAAMVVGDLGRLEPTWLRPYHARMIAAADAGKHDAIKRNVMRYFSELPLEELSEENAGNLLDVAFRLFESPTEAVAIRVFSMQIVANFTEEYPELKDELRAVIELTIAEGTTPGFRSRGTKILRKL
ncbi:MAG: hypothetical protein AAFN92_21520 [Bacteroidota bacterium]